MKNTTGFWRRFLVTSSFRSNVALPMIFPTCNKDVSIARLSFFVLRPKLDGR